MIMKRTRILIADDHKMFAQGLESLLEDEFVLLGTVGDGEAMITESQRLNPDVILVDISMPRMNGLDAVRRLTEQGNPAKVIFLTMHADNRLLAEAFRCGGSGYVLKQSAGEDLVDAIKQVLSGENYITPLMYDGKTQDLSKQKLTLSPRQREVLQLVVDGLTMKEVATHLGISTRTAESYKYEMMQALGVESTAELIQYAIKLGFNSA